MQIRIASFERVKHLQLQFVPDKQVSHQHGGSRVPHQHGGSRVPHQHGGSRVPRPTAQQKMHAYNKGI